jgi:uncharacterized repeat protein (TIGR01451 family)
MKQKIIICLLAFAAFCSFSTLKAQGWDKTFTSPLGDTTFATSVVETLDSGFVFAGGSANTINGSAIFNRLLVVKTDKRGNVVWSYNPSNLLTLDTAKVLRTSDNNFIILTTDIVRLGTPEPSIVVIKLSNNGVELSRKYYLPGNRLKDADITLGLDRIVVTAEQRSIVSNPVIGANLLQLSINGDSISNRFYKDRYIENVMFGGDGQIYAAKYLNTDTNSPNGVIKFNLQGDSLWQTFRFQNFYFFKRANDGRPLINGNIKLDYDGRFLFNGQLSGASVAIFSYVFAQKKGDNSIYTFFPINEQDPSNAGDLSNFCLVKKDSIGRYILAKQLIDNMISPNKYWLRYMIATSDGGFLIAGSTGKNGRARLMKLDANGFLYANFIKGKITIDSIQNCRIDASEKGFINRVISAQKNNETRYAITDSTGNYLISLDTGNYIVKSFLPNQNWRFCTPSVTKQLSVFGTTDTVNFALQAIYYCPQMRISTTMQLLRRCFDNNFYQIRYTNEGTQAAQNAFITLKLDSLIEYVGASRPLSNRTGQTLRFNLGNVPIGFEDQFSVQVRVKCGDSTRLGQSLCTEARIFPDTICVTPANWSGANIVVSGRCDRDSVRFLIQNTGAAQSSNLRRRIVEDEIVFLNGDISIPALTSRTITVPANGKTWRLNMAQEPNNPENDFPTAVVEGCRTSVTQPISTGIVNQFPTDNGSPTIKNVCSTIVGAYDPNDKEGLPLGYKASRFIDQNQAIDYRIRFQNTGNDTAFTVVLRDTLSEFLDISSIKTGASSHKYSWAIEGQNVLIFRFDNILLVDSFRNVAASQGFVSFKINQKKDVTLGSKINNLADIYFDYNAPIRTNKTLHTVGKDFIVSVLETKSALPNVQINVFPNPFNAEATVDIQGFEKITPLSNLSHFRVFDAVGRQLRSEKFEGTEFRFKKQDLTTGLYFFRIENNGQLIGTGKFLIK